jgi:glycosyltransferase involved in cell wall biosynthesis
MNTDLTVSVIIPAYNEERRLPTTLHAIVEFLHAQPYASEIIVVDDGSSDNTAAVVEAFEMPPRVPGYGVAELRVIRNDHRGKAVAVRTGMLAARARYVLFTDADLAVAFEEWSQFHEHLEAGNDVVIASREGLGAKRIGEPWYRHMMGRIFNMLVRVVALGGVQDTQCGFKAFTHEAAQRIFRSVQLYGANAGSVRGPAVTAFDVEVLFLARKWGYKVREVPVMWRYGEETKVDPFEDSIRNFGDVIKVRWNDLRGRYVSHKELNKS